MPARNVILSLLAVSTLLFLAGCGSSSPKATAPPSGGFSNSSLNGNYVFSTTGVDVNNSPLTVVGAFAASGGTISGGSIDVLDLSAGISSNQPITSGSYSVTADGRGQIQLKTSTVLGSTLGLDFVLTSSSHGLITQFDGNGTGSGTIDLQSTSLSQSSLSGLSYAFSLFGYGSTSTFATAGSITLGSTGNATSGIQDFNNGGSPTTAQAISTSSFITVGTGTTPGTASLVTNVGTFGFDVYAIDSTHLKLIENDSQFTLSGDAFTQATALPSSGTLAFTMAGLDSAASPFSAGGLIPLDANSNVAAGGVEDFNDAGNVGQDTGFAGGFSSLGGGPRSVLTLTSFVNGAANDLGGTYTFAAYPFTSNGVSGVQLLEIDSTAVGANLISSGTAYLETSTSLAASQGYGLNLSGANTSGEEDDIAEFTTTSSGYTGIVDLNDQGALSFDKSLTGSYSAGGTGRYTATTTNYFNYDLYVVNGSTFLLLETDSAQVGTGIVELQSASGVPGIARPAKAVLRPAARANSLFRGK